MDTNGKKILHLEVPVEWSKDKHPEFYLSPKVLGDFLQIIKSVLGDEWLLIATPCPVTIAGNGEENYTFNIKEFSKKEIMNLVKYLKQIKKVTQLLFLEKLLPQQEKN